MINNENIPALTACSDLLLAAVWQMFPPDRVSPSNRTIARQHLPRTSKYTPQYQDPMPKRTTLGSLRNKWPRRMPKFELRCATSMRAAPHGWSLAHLRCRHNEQFVYYVNEARTIWSRHPHRLRQICQTCPCYSLHMFQLHCS